MAGGLSLAYVSNVNRPSVTVASAIPCVFASSSAPLCTERWRSSPPFERQALQLGVKDLYEFTLDRIPVALRLYEDQKLQSTKAEPNGGVEVIGSTHTPIADREA